MPTDLPTPGERCYAAFWQVQRTDGHYHYPPPFAQLPEVTRQAWEAAAQAVLAQAGLLVLDLDPEETRDV